MGSELEMGKHPPQNAGNTTQVSTQTVDLFNPPSNACCFCWCCCCSCSCLTVHSAKEERILTTVSEKQDDDDTSKIQQLPFHDLDGSKHIPPGMSFQHQHQHNEQP
ncbi:hypothetical protein Q8A67_002607 [Cirrhinus molitorella]|uniref:Uncharacterized protein n=1 Tax=Cirrhinus molitorella TaxID=172907 RepID=A0AA88QDZ8_9TELE|nr:hypothetical protein Q8A67_002607 [Cirrhinus molitorella]